MIVVPDRSILFHLCCLPFTANKLILGIPTYGRTWKLNEDSGSTGVPPLQADGQGAEGYLTHIDGILSYPEICTMLPNANNHGTKGLLRKVTDPSKKLGKVGFLQQETR